MGEFKSFYIALLILCSIHEHICYPLDKPGQPIPVVAGGLSDGEYPLAGVIMDAKGNLYGDTYEGGGTGCAEVTAAALYE